MTTKPRAARPQPHPTSRVKNTATHVAALGADCLEVVKKLKQAHKTAAAGATAGALIVAIDHEGQWSADLAGQLAHDSDTLCAIVCRLLGGCVALK